MRKVTCTVIVACLTAGAGCHKEEKGVAPTAASSALRSERQRASPSASAPVLPAAAPRRACHREGPPPPCTTGPLSPSPQDRWLHVVLKNNVVKSGGKPLAHNWVLFAGRRAATGRGFVERCPPEKDIVAHPPVPPGEFKDVTFTVTEPGKYQFRCTVPGHPATMTGVMTVEP